MKPSRAAGRAALVILVAASCAACGDDDGTAGPDAGGGGPDAGTQASVGAIRVAEIHAPFGEVGMVEGQLWNADFAGFHTEVMNDGTCRLLVLESSFCDPACTNAVCVDGACRAFPDFTDAGTLTVSGLKVPVDIDPGAYGFNGYGYSATLAADVFDDGGAIEASAPGAEFPAFAVSAAGVAPLEATIDNDEITLVNGSDHTFQWVAGDGSARVRLTINANNAAHGLPYDAIIECDAPDEGSLTIPQAMIEMFPETSRWEVCAGNDCPLSRVIRYHRGATTVNGGELELFISSDVLFWVVHQAI